MTLDKLMSDYRKMILIQVEDMENFPDPEMWTDNLLIALRTISKKWVLNELVPKEKNKARSVQAIRREMAFNACLKEIKDKLE